MLVNFNQQSEGAPLIRQNERFSLDRVAVIILGGGEGKRLSPLTKVRCKPTMSFGGRYSLIDVPISHSISSGLSKIYVIGQYLAYTLQKHLFETYLNYGAGQIQLLVPEERDSQRIWYKGTADAVRQNLDYFSEIQADYFLILSGDQLYNINFQEMIDFGLQTNAGMLIAAQPVNKKNAKRMGLMKLQHGGSRVVAFQEKPQEDEILQQFETDSFTLHGLGYENQDGCPYLGSMGIYLCKRQALFDLLKEDHREDFGKHLITTQMKKGDVHAYLYDGYWEDIGTIDSYYHANLALTRQCEDRRLGLQCYNESSQILTKSYNLPGAQISNCRINNALICEGSMVNATEITQSVIGVRSMLESGVVVRDSILMGNEYYTRAPLISGEVASTPSIGENSLISKAIIDENVTIGKGVRLVNQHGYEQFDSLDGKIHVRDGIVIVPRGTHIPDNYIF